MNRWLLVISLIGGILMLIGVFGLWTEGHFGGGRSSLWDMRDPFVLTAGILVVSGALAVMGLGMENFAPMMPVGGFLALIYAIQNCRTLGKIDADIGYAVPLVIIGSLMAIVGIFGAEITREKKN